MGNEVENISILRLTGGDRKNTEDVVAREFPLTIILNNQELVTLLCSPVKLKYLAIGFLFSEGLINRQDEIRQITVDEQRGIVRVAIKESGAVGRDTVFKRFITSGCGRGAAFYSADDARVEKVESRVEISTRQVLAMVKEFQNRSEIYRATGGVHSAALCDTKSILLFSEDIGRHNAVDKIFGECLLEGIPTDERIVITSGRISSEILLKVAKRRIPIIISKSAPTDLGVRLASELGITLLGFVRGNRINAYAHDWRIVSDNKTD